MTNVLIYLGLGIILLSACMLDGNLIVAGIGILIGCLIAVPGIIKENRNVQG